MTLQRLTVARLRILPFFIYLIFVLRFVTQDLVHLNKELQHHYVDIVIISDGRNSIVDHLICVIFLKKLVFNAKEQEIGLYLTRETYSKVHLLAPDDGMKLSAELHMGTSSANTGPPHVWSVMLGEPLIDHWMVVPLEVGDQELVLRIDDELADKESRVTWASLDGVPIHPANRLVVPVKIQVVNWLISLTKLSPVDQMALMGAVGWTAVIFFGLMDRSMEPRRIRAPSSAGDVH